MRLIKEFCVRFREYTGFFSVDDKAKVAVGPPGVRGASVLRSGRQPIPDGQEFLADDHDFSQKSLTPGVFLVMDPTNMPEAVSQSWYQGRSYVGFKDSVFEPSEPWRHLEETIRIYNMTTKPPLMVMYSDAGPDRSLKRPSVQLAMTMFFLKSDLDMLVVARTAPRLSFYNPVERVMSAINFGLQNTALCMDNCPHVKKPLVQGCNTMTQIRQRAMSKYEGRDYETYVKWYHEGLNSARKICERQVSKCMWAKQALQTYPAAPYQDVLTLTQECVELLRKCVGINATALQKVEKKLEMLEPVDAPTLQALGGDFGDFFQHHVIITEYMLQFRKKVDCQCPFCVKGVIKAPRMPRYQDLHPVPAPVPYEGKDADYQSFDELFNGTVNGRHVPKVHHENPATRKRTAFQARYAIKCQSCNKPRLLYTLSESKPTLRWGPPNDRDILSAIDDLGIYICGMSAEELLNLGDNELESLNRSLKLKPEDVICVETLQGLTRDPLLLSFDIGLLCEHPVEKNYFGSTMLPTTLKNARNICIVCGTDEFQRPAAGEEESQYAWAYPSCINCRRIDPHCVKWWYGGKKKIRSARAMSQEVDLATVETMETSEGLTDLEECSPGPSLP